jgi:arsenite-transporting ATPase
MVVEESKRSYMYLNLYNFNVDGIYINRLIPQEIENNFFKEWKENQSKYLEELNSSFSNIPIYKVKWYEEDINGVEALDRIVSDSLKEENIFDILETTLNEVFEKTENGYKLEVYVPFTDKKDFALFESGSDVIIKIGNFKRNIPIPNSIRKYSIASAKLNSEKLSIYFE